MKKSLTVFIVLAGVIILAFIAFMIWGLPYFLDTALPAPMNAGFGSETVPAQVMQILDEGTVNLGGTTQSYQELSVMILSGQYKDVVAEVDYGKNQIQPEGIHFRPGDKIMVVVSSGPGNNNIVVDYADAVRTRPISILLAVFVLYLIQVPGIKIDLRGLLLGGIIIGSLGVLDDLIITQASAVFELREANPALGLRQLYQRAYRIGQDHVASTVNTLVMAYTGVALPLLLLFAVERGNYSQLINVASVAEEIVRTLVGSLGLVAAVPVSTLIATLLALYSDRLGVIRPYLGSETGGELHSH